VVHLLAEAVLDYLPVASCHLAKVVIAVVVQDLETHKTHLEVVFHSRTKAIALVRSSIDRNWMSLVYSAVVLADQTWHPVVFHLFVV
jgi:hypothetical protein